jgi:hypothetical protein
VFTNATRDEVMSIATGLAKGELERIKGLGFADVNDENRDNPASFIGDFNNYSWQVRVDKVPNNIVIDNKMVNYKQVEARVTNPILGDISLKTMVTNY